MKRKKVSLYLLFISTTFLTCAHDLFFVIVIPSYNNKAYYTRNLDSVLAQEYNNYHVIYTDDCSQDETGECVEQYIAHHKAYSTITLIKNKVRKGALKNIYQAVHRCKADTIIVCLDGDDWFAHSHVLTYLNKVYQDPNIWLTYGQFRYYPTQKRKGLCEKLPLDIIRQKKYRKFKWVTSHLRTFYAGLFQQILQEDLWYKKDQFFPMAWDLAMMFPMLEMAGEHYAFIPDILYIYNMENPINDQKKNGKLQVACAKMIRKKPKYPTLTEKPF